MHAAGLHDGRVTNSKKMLKICKTMILPMISFGLHHIPSSESLGCKSGSLEKEVMKIELGVITAAERSKLKNTLIRRPWEQMIGWPLRTWCKGQTQEQKCRDITSKHKETRAWWAQQWDSYGRKSAWQGKEWERTGWRKNYCWNGNYQFVLNRKHFQCWGWTSKTRRRHLYCNIAHNSRQAKQI